jgi:hypothetical protein
MQGNGVGDANQHLLGIAATQSAGSAVRQVVCYGDTPSCSATPRCGCRTARAGAKHYEIKSLDGVCQRKLSCGGGTRNTLPEARGSFHEECQ